MTSSPDLFDSGRQQAFPLARRMRPRRFEDFMGQSRLLGEGGVVRRLLDQGRLFSFIFYGPAGTGKTACAHLVAGHSGAHLEQLNAVTAGVADLKRVLAAAEERLKFHGQRTVLFIDEIHRFNKLQQDGLLPAVEDGIVYLIGVTTQNPSFYVNPALLSRCQLVEFFPLSEEDLSRLLDRAMQDASSGLGGLGLTLEDGARDLLLRHAAGDGRRALNLLELAAATLEQGHSISRDAVASVSSEALARYDRDGDAHYDIASAFIKSMRGTAPDAVLHYLARMLAGGEDPRFIMRRILIAASEDVGLADSGALATAAAAATAVERVGMPEAALILAHAALRVTLAPKSHSATLGIQAAQRDLQENGPLPLPEHLRDSHGAAAAATGRGTGYRYPHDYPHHYVEQEYLVAERSYYHPSDMGREADFRKWLDFLQQAK